MKAKSFIHYIGNRYDLRKVSAFTLLMIILTTVAKCYTPFLAYCLAVAYLIFCGLFLFSSLMAWRKYHKA